MTALERLRSLCMEYPGASERLSHGEPTWFVGGKRVFAMFADHHHDDRVAVWLPAGPGVQEALLEAEPSRYFRPPYVGPSGWIGVFLDVEVDWIELSCLIEEAYLKVAPSKLAMLVPRDVQR